MAAASTGMRRGSRKRTSAFGSWPAGNGIPDGLAASALSAVRDDVYCNKGYKDRVKQALVKKKYNVEDFYWEDGCWQAIAKSKYFDNITLGVIGLNSVWIWIDTDYNHASTLLDAHWLFQVGENLFCCFFFFEWLVRFMSFKRKLDGLKDKWFVFDTVLVGMMVLETWIFTAILIFANAGAGGGNLGTASVLRLFRLLRLTRMLRMLRSMTELMILIKGMVSAMRSVGTVMFLQVIVMYVFGIAVTQLAAGSDAENAYFSDVWHSMYTLMVYGVFLDSIATLCNDVGRAGDFYGMCLVFLLFLFVLVATLTVLNMLIGVLCEVVSRVADKERNDLGVAFVTQKLQNVVQAIDQDGNLRISKSEFESLLGKRLAVRALRDADVDPEDLVENMDYVFARAEQLNGEDEPALNFLDFMEVVLELRGSNVAKVRDVIKLQKHISQQFQVCRRALAPEARASKPTFKSALRRSATSSLRQESPRAPVTRQSSSATLPMATSTNSATLVSPVSSSCVGAPVPPLPNAVDPPQPEQTLPRLDPEPSDHRQGSQPLAQSAQENLQRKELNDLRGRTARLEDMLGEIMAEVRGLAARVQAQKRRSKKRAAIADSTGGID